MASVVTWRAAEAAVIDAGAYYQIIASHSGKALDIEQASGADSARVIQSAPNVNAASQQFQIVATDGGFYKLKVRHSGKVVDIEFQSLLDGAQAVQYADLNTPNQQFRVVDAADNTVRLVGRQSGKALDVEFAGLQDGARVLQWSDYDAPNQRWRLVRVGPGTPPTSGPPNSPPPSSPPPDNGSGRQMEDLNRGLMSVRSGNGNLVSWRLFGHEATDTGFNLYRGGTRVNPAPITNSTNYLDNGAAAGVAYTVRAVVNGVEQANSEPSLRFGGGNYWDVPIQSPGGGYVAEEASPGDLDGDGQLDLVVKWDPANAKDSSHDGVTGNVFIDGYKLGGTRMWRIDLGRNIRAGAHYTQFQVYDYNGDGTAEVAMKTGDGTVDGVGRVIGNGGALHRNGLGHILAGPEYLTVFNGVTGGALATVPFQPARGNLGSWGDSEGNRSERYLAATAYLNGQTPSIIMARGYYGKSVIAAFDFSRDNRITQRWIFDSSRVGSNWGGRGTHSLSIADVDRNGTDEIIYGGMTINSNGTGRYTTPFYAHGDALHVGDFLPNRPGLEIWQIHEDTTLSASLRDANNGAIIFSRTKGSNVEGPARGVAGDIYAGSPGAEFWGFGQALNNLYEGSGRSVGRTPSSANFLAWFDADPVRELLDGTRIDKYRTSGDARLLTGAGVRASNGTKATPALSGDILGDWREEVIWRTSNSSALRIYATTAPTNRRIHTLLHDSQYRVALAWQNTAYNQPPHPSFFIGEGMGTPPRPNIYVR